MFRNALLVAAIAEAATGVALVIAPSLVGELLLYGDLDATLDVIAAWLIAAYGGRIERISLWLEGYYGPVSECYGIAPVRLDRGVRPEGGQETRETLPSREIRDHAEALFSRLCPGIQFIRIPGRDVREVASSGLMSADGVSGHRKIELLRAYGPLPVEGTSSTPR